ncbi:hypothetical protein LHEJCM20397_11460 [Lactobacillus helveticus]|nr:hypothetical protein LHEJCM1006_14450 [Lactobacillus helveticus]GFP17598.1 hypothetical protein LHEJCM20397_11460 [Lactobacillus helveticus]GIP66033.1 hypothetical protein LhelvAHU1049_02380 [Lactobacillus helveticus]
MKHTVKAYLLEMIIYLGGNKHDRLFKETDDYSKRQLKALDRISKKISER